MAATMPNCTDRVREIENLYNAAVNVEFSDHAELKILQRGLRHEQIAETVLHPDFRRASYSSREELFKRFAKKYLKVVIVKEGETIIVVTAHWVAKLPKR